MIVSRHLLFLKRGASHMAELANSEQLVWPRAAVRHVPSEVTGTVREDCEQATLVLTDSPKASAALSRRCRVGNYSAHPIKSTQTGAVVDVDPAEAEYNLDVLDLLFDFYYVQPAKAQALQHRVHAKG